MNYRNYKNLNQSIKRLLIEKALPPTETLSSSNSNILALQAPVPPPPTLLARPNEKELQPAAPTINEAPPGWIDSLIQQFINIFINNMNNNYLFGSLGLGLDTITQLLYNIIQELLTNLGNSSPVQAAGEIAAFIAELLAQMDPLEELTEEIGILIVGTTIRMTFLQMLLIFGSVIGITIGLEIANPRPRDPGDSRFWLIQAPNGEIYSIFSGFGHVTNSNGGQLTQQQIDFMRNNPADFIEVPPGSGIWWCCPGCMNLTTNNIDTAGLFLGIPGFDPTDPAYSYIPGFQPFITQPPNSIPPFLPASVPPPGYTPSFGGVGPENGFVYVDNEGVQYMWMDNVPGVGGPGWVILNYPQ